MSGQFNDFGIRPPTRKTEPKAGHWADESNYQGGTVTFFHGEIALIGKKKRPPKSFDRNEEFANKTESEVGLFCDQVWSMALHGLYGCTAVVVVSRKGALMLHFYETPSIIGKVVDKDANDNPIYEPEANREERFKIDIIDSLHSGGGLGARHQAGIENCRNNTIPEASLRGYENLFDKDAHPRVFIMTPKRFSGLPAGEDAEDGSIEYVAQVERIKDEIKKIFKDSPDLPLQYVPYGRNAIKKFGSPADGYADEHFRTHLGKILVMYQPKPRIGTSKYRVLFEGRAVEDGEDEWLPQPAQPDREPLHKVAR